jgi:hypothetical protein
MLCRSGVVCVHDTQQDAYYENQNLQSCGHNILMLIPILSKMNPIQTLLFFIR